MASKSLRAACVLVALGFAAAAQAQTTYYSITGGGGQAQIGGGLPLPIQAATTGGTMMNPIGTGTMFPPLLIPVNPNPSKAIVKQTNGADPKQMTVPVGAFHRVPAKALTIGVALNNPTVYQVRSNIEFSGPAPLNGSAVFKKGGRTGAKTQSFTGPPKSVLFPGKIIYSKSAAQFGGPSRTKVVPLSVVRAWAHGPTGNPPCKHPAFAGGDGGCVGVIVEAHPMTLAVAGAMVGVVDTTPGGLAMSGVPGSASPGLGAVQAVSVPTIMGIIAKKANGGMTAPISNMATSAGFPWTTGKLQIIQSSAAATPEIFTITGMDGRAGGVGTISLVSGALSDRTTSGPNSNRSWARYTLPEPGAVLGAAAALAVLGLCHGLVRRRSR